MQREATPTPPEIITPSPCVIDRLVPEPADQQAWDDQMAVVADRFHTSRVAAVYLVNGTFCGDDPHGIWASLDCRFPNFATRRRRGTTKIVDAVAGEAGNFTIPYARDMERGLRRRTGSLARAAKPRVERLYWSGENHHLGRATGAMQFLDKIMRHEWEPDERILFMAQSHGGSVLALISLLLGGDASWRESFFEAAEVFARTNHATAAHPVWHRVRKRLDAGDLPFRPEQLDFVTLGSPITYPFEPAGHGRVLHLINHRPRPDRPPERTGLPRSFGDLTRGADGDYVHQIGITGSNFAPLLWCWRQMLANRRLRDLLGGQRAWRSYFSRLRSGVRVRAGSNTRLIDYGVAERRRIYHVLGHGVYTHHRHMLPQLEQIVAGLYDAR